MESDYLCTTQVFTACTRVLLHLVCSQRYCQSISSTKLMSWCRYRGWGLVMYLIITASARINVHLHLYSINFPCVVPCRGQASIKPCTPIGSLAARSGDGLLTLFSCSTEKDSMNTSWSHPPLRQFNTLLDWHMLCAFTPSHIISG